jgi:serine/threonine-protein kinase
VRAIHGGPAASASSEAHASEGHPTSADAAVRTIGRYALHAEIAAGGMATIHIGRLLGPVGFARTVAIKRLHPPLAKDPEFVAMFLDEARLAARIRHPNVVSTLDVVATEGELFVVMEYVPGESLARLLRAVRSNKEIVPVPIAATILVGVLHGLHAAHEARDERGDPLRIVHRDVSPHNILVGTDGDAHVIDFGIAKARGRMQVTRQGQIKGKLSYMPSEQLLGQAIDHRADIFAASIVLWEALTGQRLFQGTDDGEVYAKVLLGKVEAPSVHAKGVTRALDAIVLRGLARDRTQRYGTAREMALALEAAIPLAPPSQVGSWVDGLVGDSLAERTEQIAHIERLVDGAEPGATSSAVMTFGGLPSPANEQRLPSDPPPRPNALPRADRTGPTQPVGMHAPSMAEANATVVERRVPAALLEEPLAPASDAPRRRPRRLLVASLLLLPLIGYGALRSLRAQDTTMAASAASPAAKSPPVADHPAAAPLSTFTATASADWVPAQLPAAVTLGAHEVTVGSSEPTAPQQKPVVPSVQGAHPIAPRGSANAPGEAQAQPHEAVTPAVTATKPATANGSSCDPPFYIDADGTKRYKRYCANL